MGHFWCDLGCEARILELAKSEKSGGVEFCCYAQQVARGRRHHLCDGLGVVAAPAWLIAPRLATSKKRRREIEEGMNYTKMHKN